MSDSRINTLVKISCLVFSFGLALFNQTDLLLFLILWRIYELEKD